MAGIFQGEVSTGEFDGWEFSKWKFSQEKFSQNWLNKDAKDRREFSTILYHEKDEKNVALCTYTVKTKSSGKKNVILLSLIRPLAAMANDVKKQKKHSRPNGWLLKHEA